MRKGSKTGTYKPSWRMLLAFLLAFGQLWHVANLNAQQPNNSLRNNSAVPQFTSPFQTSTPQESGNQQESATGNSQPAVTADAIEAVRKQAAESAELDAETKQKVESACVAALEGLRKVGDLNQKAAKFQQESAQIAERVASLQKNLTTLQQAKPSPPNYSDLSMLEAEVTKREADLEKLKIDLSKAEAAPAERVKRRQEIRSLLLTYDQRLADVQQQLDTAPPADEPPLLTTARKQLLTVTKMAIQAEQPALINERGKLEAEEQTDLTRIQRDILARQTNLAEAELQALQKQLSRQRAIDLKYKRDIAEADATKPYESIRSHAQENLKFADDANLLAEPLQETNRKLESAKETLEEVQKNFKAIEKRVNEIGLTGSIGQLLRRQKTELPDLRKLRSNVRDRKSLIEDVQYKIFEYDDLRSRTAGEDLQRIRQDLSQNELQQLEAAANDPAQAIDPQADPRYPEYIVKKRREYLDDLLRNYKSYLDTLFDLDATEQRLILETQKYQTYIDERVLWIRSNKPLFTSFSIDASDRWALDPENWKTIAQKITTDFQRNYLIYILAFVVFSLLIYHKKRFRQTLEEQGQTAARGSCIQFTPTLKAGLITLLLAVIWPGILTFVSWRLNAVANGSLFARALAQAIFSVAWTLMPLELLRRVCRQNGLADSHFDWPETMITVLRTNIRWFIPFSIAVALITSLLFYSQPEHGVDAIERCTFIFGLLVLLIFLRRLLHPESGMLREYYAQNPDRWIGRLQGLWYWAGTITPLVLIVMTIMGYYFTAQRLTAELYTSILFLIATLLLKNLLQRLLLVRRRAISIEQARERLMVAREANKESGSESSQSGVEQFLSPEDTQPDINANTEQTRKLIQTGFLVTFFIGTWLLWVDVLPAFKMLDRWPLWTTTVPVSAATEAPQAAISPTGMPVMPTSSTVTSAVASEKLEAVTIADLGLAILIGIVTFICARNIPGLMEMSVLQKLPMDNSVRYAITTITSYIIVLLGLIMAFNAISIGWSKVQWLATALTFGLAFGLQEIFANFVAGLILLFERPIRVGDIVTIDGIDGVVSRIRIRATTITNWDRKEYVVPNKEFITGRMLNWTLTDKISRVVINIGVAYGSDTDLAKSLLRKICEEHPLILDDPSTLVTFEGFGDNTLNLVLRTFLPDLDNRLKVIDELHSTIDKKFREAGVEIAFPQHDLHLRSIDPNVVKGLRRINNQKTA